MGNAKNERRDGESDSRVSGGYTRIVKARGDTGHGVPAFEKKLRDIIDKLNDLESRLKELEEMLS